MSAVQRGKGRSRCGLRVTQVMTLMTVGLYNEPAGAYLPCCRAEQGSYSNSTLHLARFKAALEQNGIFYWEETGCTPSLCAGTRLCSLSSQGWRRLPTGFPEWICRRTMLGNGGRCFLGLPYSLRHRFSRFDTYGF
jgi:hypothetical protein